VTVREAERMKMDPEHVELTAGLFTRKKRTSVSFPRTSRLPESAYEPTP
jgi:hypothetical protein